MLSIEKYLIFFWCFDIDLGEVSLKILEVTCSQLKCMLLALEIMSCNIPELFNF